MQETNIPSILELFIGGFGGHSYSAKLVDGQLYYRDELYEKSLEDLLPVYPSEQQWRKFYDDLNKLRVWELEESYINNDVLDGTSWGIQISWDGKSVNSSGSNAYPGAAGADESKQFKKFLLAVRKLLGGLDFS